MLFLMLFWVVVNFVVAAAVVNVVVVFDVRLGCF